MSLKKATLSDGRIVEYVEVGDPPAGGMKKTYFAPDRSYVIQFFHDSNTGKDPQRMARLEAILGKYNPTVPEEMGGARGTSRISADYFKHKFCWPTGIVVKPDIGIMSPTYPSNYFFGGGPFKGLEKEGKWFSSPRVRRHVPASELGSFLGYLQLCLCLARSVRRLHQAGLAHSDLSSKNVLVDPLKGQSVIIDIDSLVVPSFFPPDVLGTPGYIAPEVLATQYLNNDDPKRKLPCSMTDLHALAVLIYEYLFFRHPLRGSKVHANSAEEDEWLSMGSKAVFIENKSDTSNRPTKKMDPELFLDIQKNSYDLSGPYLTPLFEKAFVNGLHCPNERPSAMEWERALIKTLDLLVPCHNKDCSHKIFIIKNLERPYCPYCGTKPPGKFPVLHFFSERRGNWMPDGQLAVYNNQYVYKWHAFDNIFPGEEADRTPQGYCVYHQNQWLLVNQNMASLTSPKGSIVPSQQAVALTDGAKFRFAQEEHGRLVEVQMVGN